MSNISREFRSPKIAFQYSVPSEYLALNNRRNIRVLIVLEVQITETNR